MAIQSPGGVAQARVRGQGRGFLSTHLCSRAVPGCGDLAQRPAQGVGGPKWCQTFFVAVNFAGLRSYFPWGRVKDAGLSGAATGV